MAKYNVEELIKNYHKVCNKLTEEELRLLTNLMDYKILCQKELIIIELIREYPEYKTHFGLRLKQRLEDIQEDLSE